MDDLNGQIEKLLNLYKTNFDLAVQSINQMEQRIEKLEERTGSVLTRFEETGALLETMIGDTDTITERLVKATAAIVQVTQEIADRYNQGNG